MYSTVCGLGKKHWRGISILLIKLNFLNPKQYVLISFECFEWLTAICYADIILLQADFIKFHLTFFSKLSYSHLCTVFYEELICIIEPKHFKMVISCIYKKTILSESNFKPSSIFIVLQQIHVASFNTSKNLSILKRKHLVMRITSKMTAFHLKTCNQTSHNNPRMH